MLQYMWVAQSEHREWERQFNIRAARGEFVRSFEQPQRRAVQLRLRPRIEQVRAVVGQLLSPVWSAIR